MKVFRGLVILETPEVSVSRSDTFRSQNGRTAFTFTSSTAPGQLAQVGYGELATTAPERINPHLMLCNTPFHHLELVKELVQQHMFDRQTERFGPAAVHAERGMAHASNNCLPVAARTDKRSTSTACVASASGSRSRSRRESISSTS